jgi:hypothetical protein
MAEQPPNFQFEDVPLDEARRMGRGPRMEPMLYDTLRHKIEVWQRFGVMCCRA